MWEHHVPQQENGREKNQIRSLETGVTGDAIQKEEEKRICKFCA